MQLRVCLLTNSVARHCAPLSCRSTCRSRPPPVRSFSGRCRQTGAVMRSPRFGGPSSRRSLTQASTRSAANSGHSRRIGIHSRPWKLSWHWHHIPRPTCLGHRFFTTGQRRVVPPRPRLVLTEVGHWPAAPALCPRLARTHMVSSIRIALVYTVKSVDALAQGLWCAHIEERQFVEY